MLNLERVRALSLSFELVRHDQLVLNIMRKVHMYTAPFSYASYCGTACACDRDRVQTQSHFRRGFYLFDIDIENDF